MPMWDCKCTKDDCQCAWCGDACGCGHTTWGTQFGAWDVQEIDATNDITFSAIDIAKMNRIFGEMDLTSDVQEDTIWELTEDDISWLKEKFGWDTSQS